MLQFPKRLLPHLSKNHVSGLLYQSLLASAIEEDNFLLNTTSCSCRKPSGCILLCCSNIWFYTELHFVYFDPFSTSTECLCPKPCYQFSTRGCLKAKKKPYGLFHSSGKETNNRVKYFVDTSCLQMLEEKTIISLCR